MEFRAFTRHQHIAGEGKRQAAARRRAVHGRDDRLRACAHGVHRVAQHPVAIGAVLQHVGLAKRFKVGAGGEAAPRAAHDDHARGRIAAARFEIGEKLLGHRLVDGVQPVRPVQRDALNFADRFNLKNVIAHENARIMSQDIVRALT